MRRNGLNRRLSEGEEEAGMVVTEGQHKALLELQRTWIPCDGDHEWVDDEKNQGEQYCAKCMVIKNSQRPK